MIHDGEESGLGLEIVYAEEGKANAANGGGIFSGTSEISMKVDDPKDLVWSGISMRVIDPKTGGTKLDILRNVWGRAEAGKTTAIMGASGAGR